LLSDAGWNIPATQFDAADSELPAPSWEMLQEVLQQQAARQTDAGLLQRSSSAAPGIIGAYLPADVNADGDPLFGCNADPTLVDDCEIEDVIGNFIPAEDLDQYAPISWLAQSSSQANHFNRNTGGQEHSMVYQLLSRTIGELGPEPLLVGYLESSDYAVNPG